MVFFWVLIPFIARKYLDEKSQRNLAIFLIIAIIGVEIIDDLYRIFETNPQMIWSAAGDLPLHMCGFSVFATSYALAKKDQLVFELCYFWGLGGALQAILTPDFSRVVDPFYLFTFMISHGLIILNIFYLIFVYKMVLRKWALLRTIVITNIILVGIGLINFILDSNYFYLSMAPDVNNPLILSRVQPWYFMNMEFVAIIVFYILSIPMILYRKKVTRVPVPSGITEPVNEKN
tara:strand:+ start:748 stop:1446 length:699 start_codon:yes stop_codon:yes gene_type:complete